MAMAPCCNSFCCDIINPYLERNCLGTDKGCKLKKALTKHSTIIGEVSSLPGGGSLQKQALKRGTTRTSWAKAILSPYQALRSGSIFLQATSTSINENIFIDKLEVLSRRR